MRYDTPLLFVKSGSKVYDPDTGKWENGSDVRIKKYANVTHMSAECQQKVFGDVKSNRYIIRLQRVYADSYDYIEMYGKKYTVDTERFPSDKQSLVVIQNG